MPFGVFPPVADERCMDLAYLSVFLVLGDLEDGLSFMVQLRPDMAADVVIGLVQMKDGMDVEIVLAGPFHQ